MVAHLHISQRGGICVWDQPLHIRSQVTTNYSVAQDIKGALNFATVLLLKTSESSIKAIKVMYIYPNSCVSGIVKEL